MLSFDKNEWFCFDDVLLFPQYSDIESRKLVKINTKIAGIELEVPILSANMDSITENIMCKAMWKAGGLGILHRYIDDKKFFDQVRTLTDPYTPFIPSIGVNEEDRERALKIYHGYLVDSHIGAICIDVAHGYSKKCLEMIKFLKDGCGFKVIAGNVASMKAAEALIRTGADVIKVGLGPGSLCTTRLVTGHGVPQLSAILDVAQLKDIYKFDLIADGGIRNSGDIVKALAAGADAVMIGRLFAGTWETPGEVVQGKKVYRGSASFSAQVDHGGLHGAPEGESALVNVQGSVKDIVKNLADGIRSGLSYSGCNSIKELQENAMFIRVSTNTTKENGISESFR